MQSDSTKICELYNERWKIEEGTEEIWKPIPGYEGYYEASSFGRIKSLPRRFVRKDGRPHTIKGCILQPLYKAMYPSVDIHIDGVTYHHSIHELILITLLDLVRKD